MFRFRPQIAVVLCLLFTLLGACSSTPNATVDPSAYPEPVFSAERILPENYVDPMVVYDPWQVLNKRIYNFNYEFDRWVFIPVVRSYRQYVPQFMRTGVTNFFANIRDVGTVLNSVLQFQPKKTMQSTGRVFANSTLGLFGLIDVASEMGIPRPQEDFGQTLGYWGVPEGPFLVLPFLGPSNLRDGLGLLPDYYVQTEIENAVLSRPLRSTALLLDAVDRRDDTPFRYYESGYVFEYQMLRWLYNAKRKLDIAK